MGKISDRSNKIMHELWGTNCLATDYHALDKLHENKLLREINHDEITPKKYDFKIQNEIHQSIRNADNYDDWEYGTEPLPYQKW